MQKRIVYFVSESTGITASYMAKSLLSQFPNILFEKRFSPYVNSMEAANHLLNEWQSLKDAGEPRPLVFATMAEIDINDVLKDGYCEYYEFFTTFVTRMEEDLQTDALHRSGLSHGLNNPTTYDESMDIINYALNHDDAIRLEGLEKADVILVGVSRSGKTPTCLYLALHYGIRAANYPLTDDDFEKGDIPQVLKKHKHKMLALKIDPERLCHIRQKRRPNSQYASYAKCIDEVKRADRFYLRYGLPVLNTTTSSIEELASMIVNELRLKSRNF